MSSAFSFRTYTEWWQWVLLCLFLVGVVIIGYIAWFHPDELTRPLTTRRFRFSPPLEVAIVTLYSVGAVAAAIVASTIEERVTWTVLAVILARIVFIEVRALRRARSGPPSECEADCPSPLRSPRDP
jgi:hypothetical protein